MFKIYNLFGHRDINDLIPEIIYFYLFEGYSLTSIEQRLFNTDIYHGWLSKSCLNYFGIDTDGGNKAIFKDKSIESVVNELMISTNIEHCRVGKILRDKYF